MVERQTTAFSSTWFTLLILTALTTARTQLIEKKEAFGEQQFSYQNWKVLHIMSYYRPWKWTHDQVNVFKSALRGLDMEYRIFQMDTKRRTAEQWKQRAGREARNLIDVRKADLVYTSDDNTQEYVRKYYLNSDIPFVFSGVDGDLQEYGLLLPTILQEYSSRSILWS